MSTGKRLAIGGGVIAAVVAYMAWLGASSSWQYYLTADECAARAASLDGARVRVSGKVAPHSLQIAEGRRQASFSLVGTQAAVRVVCAGIIPDNLAEDMHVVVEGRLEKDALFHGEKVMTRCASKYVSQGDAGSPEHTAANETGTRR